MSTELTIKIKLDRGYYNKGLIEPHHYLVWHVYVNDNSYHTDVVTIFRNDDIRLKLRSSLNKILDFATNVNYGKEIFNKIP